MHTRRMGAALIVLAVTLAALGAAASAAAAGDTLRIEPPNENVAKGGTFDVRVVQKASVKTSGAQATVTFDRTKVQITAVTRGTPHATAPIFVPSDIAAAIASANKSGKLKTVATAYFPPGSVPPGDADFLVVTFKAVGCGASKLGLPVGSLDAVLLDGRDATYGNALKVTTTGGTVTVDCGGASPPPGAAASAAPTTTTTPEPELAEATAAPTSPTEGEVAGTSESPPPRTDALPGATPTTTDWLPFVLLGLVAVVATVALVDGARHRGRLWR